LRSHSGIAASAAVPDVRGLHTGNVAINCHGGLCRRTAHPLARATASCPALQTGTVTQDRRGTPCSIVTAADLWRTSESEGLHAWKPRMPGVARRQWRDPCPASNTHTHTRTVLTPGSLHAQPQNASTNKDCCNILDRNTTTVPTPALSTHPSTRAWASWSGVSQAVWKIISRPTCLPQSFLFTTPSPNLSTSEGPILRCDGPSEGRGRHPTPPPYPAPLCAGTPGHPRTCFM
jgi:hypothetical protein